MNKKHIGSNFDDFLREEKLLEAAETAAVKHVVAFQLEHGIKRRKRKLATDVVTDVADEASSATSATKSAAN
jgi:hypothetical protein